MGGGRRPAVGSGAVSERERMREEGEEEKKKARGGSHRQAGKQREGVGFGFWVISLFA